MPLVLAGATSGSATVQATDAATVTLTLPATSGTLSVSGGSPSFATLTVTGDASISGLTVGKGGGNGAANTAFGINALAASAANSGVTAIGNGAGSAYTTGSGTGQSTFVGYYAGHADSTGYDNTFIGGGSGSATTSGSANTALGSQSLYSNTTGTLNVAVGYQALYSTTTQNQNVAVGGQALYSNTTGYYGTAVGYLAGYSVSTGYSNTLIGQNAGYYITTGVKNTVLGSYNGNQGGLDIRTASNYIVLSDGDGNPRFYVDNNAKTYIGRVPNGGTAGTDTTVISNTGTTGQLILQYYTTPVNFGIGVTSSNLLSIYDGGGTQQAYFQASNGNAYNRGGTWGTISDIKLKENIVDATPKLDEVMQLKVRNFNLIGNDVKQIGFIAQEFQQVFPNIVESIDDTNEDGSLAETKTLHIKSSVLIPILVKAIQEQQAIITDLTARITALEGTK